MKNSIKKPLKVNSSYFVVIKLDKDLKGPWKFKVSGLLRTFEYRPVAIKIGCTKTSSLKKALLDILGPPTGVKPFFIAKNITISQAKELQIDWLRQMQIVWQADFIHQFCINGLYIKSHVVTTPKDIKALSKYYPGVASRLEKGKLKGVFTDNYNWTHERQATFFDTGEMLYLPYNVASSKNSKQWTGKMLISSKTTKKYEKASKAYWEANREFFLKLILGKKKPLLIGIHFVRSSKRSYDWVNPVQTVQDQMVRFGWIEDDSIHDFYPVPFEVDGEYTTYNDLGGFFLKVL